MNAGGGGAGGVSLFGGGAVDGEALFKGYGAGGSGGSAANAGSPGGPGYCEVWEFISA